MQADDHFNIYEYVKKEFQIDEGKLLDVGCGKEIINLLDFHKSNFKELIGVDYCLPVDQKNTYDLYLKKKKEDRDLTTIEQSEFILKTKLFKHDVSNFDYRPEDYSLIICTSVLHFFNDNGKVNLIRSLVNAIKPGGIVFLRLNHTNHHDYKSNNVIKIAPNIYSNLDGNVVVYPVDIDLFVELLKNERFPIKNYFHNPQALTIVLQKSDWTIAYFSQLVDMS